MTLVFMTKATISLTNGYGSYCVREECQLAQQSQYLCKDEDENQGNEHTLIVEIHMHERIAHELDK